MLFPFFCISVNYKNADIKDRKRFSFSNEEISVFLKKIISHSILGSVIISTCNRTEFYFSINEDLFNKNKNQILEEVEKKICEEKNESILLFKKIIQIEFEENAVKHLFSVASGLESMILGENQILGQVRQSYFFSKTEKFTDFYLNVIFHKTLTCAKRIKTQTNLSKTTESIATLTVKEIVKQNAKSILVIGSSGEMGNLIIRDLAERKNLQIFATFRKHYNIPEFSNVQKIPYENRFKYLESSDIIVSATKNPAFTIDFENAKKNIQVLKKRLFLDLAVPNDIDSKISNIQNCLVKTIDDFKKIALENNEKKIDSISLSNSIISEEIDSIKKELLFHLKIDSVKNKTKKELLSIYNQKKIASFEEFESFLLNFQKIKD